ncbi:hypothetical protein BCR35DRAFT_350924 [Leucosporidium creatinivorum]|uniref:Protein kinase domain-containing protein n=1 Tax=Leucosporidium creatinivorum TaxID=106004 RepID=A0A1Y2FWL7_9BASI|nr:hypothetical protein BCR35DRAFT_350924 [Leucosporidium creatinivorum]
MDSTAVDEQAAPLTSQTARPCPTVRPSYRATAKPSVSLTPLTTRSSSSTRLSLLDPAALLPSERPSSTEAYRAWRRESKDRIAFSQARRVRAGSSTPPTTNGTTKRKSKAVAFVIGAPSSGSGEEADGEHDPLERDEHDDDDARIFIRTALAPRELSVDDLIRAQIRQPEYTLDPLNLDPLLPLGIADYTFVLTTPASSSSADASPAPEPKDNAPPPPHPRRVSLGKGKFSEVLLVRKGSVEYALKHTPLHPHHPLIATRLLREPTILAQLLPHPNLVKVFETIRTPGHFYLVEENLQSSVTLEHLVASSPGGVLPLNLAWSVLEQLASVVRSLHEPLRVCHRDIKPENILVRVNPSSDSNGEPTLLLKLLDFGLATHFSSSEAKLTTCCGSPAYHSPELWRGLREPSGTVKYWGPEVDIWCTGLSLLRCLSPNKYPLGISHSSLNALSDKVVDALLAIEDESMRRVLAGLLQMDGPKRMRSFEEYCKREEVVRRGKEECESKAPPAEGSPNSNAPPSPPVKKEFKSTDFIPTSPLFSLDLPLLSSTDLPDGPKPLEVTVNSGDEAAMVVRSRSPSRSRPRHRQQSSTSSNNGIDSPVSDGPALRTPGPSSSPDLTPDPYSPRALDSSLPTTPLTPNFNPFSTLASPHHSSYPPPIQLTLLNPTNEPIRRATSYIKYALRCAGILYHVRDDEATGAGFSALGQPSPHISAHDLPSSPHPFDPNAGADDSNFVTHLHCVLRLPLHPDPHTSKASSALIAALRPPMLRAQTMGNPVRSSSTPPIGTANKGGKAKKEEDVKCTTFFLSIRKGEALPSSTSERRSESSARKRRSRRKGEERIVLTLSDERALKIVRDALKIDPSGPTVPVGDVGAALPEQRGRAGRGERKEVRSPNAGSGSRDARLRRSASHFVGAGGVDKSFDPSLPTKGLAMSMGPPGGEIETPTVERKGFFDYVGGLGERLGGFMTPGGSRNASTIEEGGARREERREGGVPVVAFV